MGRRRKHVTDAELAVLKLLWRTPCLTAREITKKLYKGTTSSEIGTVQKLLQRLEAKRLVERNRRTHAHLFSATVSQTEFAGRQLEQMAEKLADGSLVPFIMHLVRAKRLSEREKCEIRQLLEDEAE